MLDKAPFGGIMLVGENGSGKSSLISALTDGGYVPKKVVALDYYKGFINSPSEFLERRWARRYLIVAAGECGTLLFLQNATRKSCQIPPQFTTMFNRRVLGVITMIDKPGADLERAQRFLHHAGVTEIFPISVATGDGIPALCAALDLPSPAISV